MDSNLVMTVIPHTMAPRQARALAKARDRLAADRARQAEVTEPPYRERQQWPILGKGWGGVVVESRRGWTSAPRERMERRAARRLATLPKAGPHMASPTRPHDPRQWTAPKQRGAVS